jgi:hypothetical protein
MFQASSFGWFDHVPRLRPTNGFPPVRHQSADSRLRQSVASVSHLLENKETNNAGESGELCPCLKRHPIVVGASQAGPEWAIPQMRSLPFSA